MFSGIALVSRPKRAAINQLFTSEDFHAREFT